jgi:D-beta-D-heptose 7-phosphate kinase / D-beta-D-heptose 1-phosphate adenosyltransferase
MQPSEWAGKKILCLGDCCLDIFLTGTISRHAPECQTCPVVDVQERTVAPGMAGNVAATVKRHGGEAVLCSVMGGDDSGDELWSALDDANVSTEGLLVDDELATAIKQRTYVGKDLILRQDFGHGRQLAPDDEDRFAEFINDRINKTDAIVLSDYGYGMCTQVLCQAIITLAKKHNVPVVVDPYRDGDWTFFAGATVIKPNLAASVGRLGELCDLTKHVLVTRGRDGMMLLSAHLDPLNIPARPCPDFAVIGAGDRVAAILALALAAGATVEDAARTAAELV